MSRRPAKKKPTASPAWPLNSPSSVPRSVIHGHANGSNLTPCPVRGYGDHRIVMAMSIAGLALDGQMSIDTAEAMNVTFPEFVTLMKQLGAEMMLSELN
ncbi:MAG: hypothetical protein ACYSOO_05480 [Planctomycetota bacterium]